VPRHNNNKQRNQCNCSYEIIAIKSKSLGQSGT